MTPETTDSETIMASVHVAKFCELGRRFLLRKLANMMNPEDVNRLLGAKSPCASIDAGIRDWDVLPGSRIPPPGNNLQFGEI